MHLCLDADLILLQYEILEGHTQLTHLHFMLPPFSTGSRTSRISGGFFSSSDGETHIDCTLQLVILRSLASQVSPFELAFLFPRNFIQGQRLQVPTFLNKPKSRVFRFFPILATLRFFSRR